MNEQIQPNMEQEMTHEEAKASLGIATFLQDQLLPVAEAEQPMEEQGEEAPVEQVEQPEEENIEEKNIEKEANMDGKFEQFKEDINKTIDDKFSQLADMIKQALIDDEQEN